jgi:hypothetical protein
VQFGLDHELFEAVHKSTTSAVTGSFGISVGTMSIVSCIRNVAPPPDGPFV